MCMAINYETMKWLFDSPYFINEPFNWHLSDDAPEELKKRFEEYKKSKSNGRE